jgi:hypothetical protein
MLSALLHEHAESLLLICLQRNSIVFVQTKKHEKGLLRAGSKLIGLLLEPVKATLPFLGSGMTLASIQA